MKIIAYLFLLFSICAFSQFQNKEGLLIYQEVVEQNGTAAEIIKNRAEAWVAKSYNDANHVTKVKNDTQLILNSQFKVLYSYMGYSHNMKIEYSLQIEYKENKYRITFNPISQEAMNMLTPIAYQVVTEENYKKAMQNQLDQAPDKATKRFIEKQMTDESLKEIVAMQKDIRSSIENHINGLVEDLKTAINNEKSKDDW